MEREARVEQLFLSTQAMVRAWKGYFVKVLAPEGISPVQMGLLFYLKTHGKVNGRNIARDLQLSPSAVTQLIDSLKDRGYIERQTSSDDRRVTFIGLTADGAAKLTIMENKNKQFFMEVTASLADQEIEAMIQAQQKIIEQVHQQAKQPEEKTHE